jgi:nitrite reductase/ring-hydroxylating ferredoxin subunit
MSENDGFIPVFDEKDLKDGEMVRTAIQDGDRTIPIIVSRVGDEVFAGGAVCPNCGRLDCKIKDGKIWVKLE